MRVFIVAGSPVARPPLGLAPQSDEKVIAADFGAHHALQWGWHIDLLVGDLDSVEPAEAAAIEKAGTPVLRVPAAKDQTDTELAVSQAFALGPDQIVVCGATGGRTDHLLANVLLLAHPLLRDVDMSLADGGETIRLLRASETIVELEVEGRQGDLLSLLPLSGNAEGVTTSGLLYPLHSETLRLGEARGVSNVLTDERARISLARGRLLIIHNRMVSE